MREKKTQMKKRLWTAKEFVTRSIIFKCWCFLGHFWSEEAGKYNSQKEKILFTESMLIYEKDVPTKTQMELISKLTTKREKGKPWEWL